MGKRMDSVVVLGALGWFQSISGKKRSIRFIFSPPMFFKSGLFDGPVGQVFSQAGGQGIIS